MSGHGLSEALVVLRDAVLASVSLINRLNDAGATCSRVHASRCGFPSASHDVALHASFGVAVLVEIGFIYPHIPYHDWRVVFGIACWGCSLTESHLHSWPLVDGPRSGGDLSQAFTGPPFILWSSSQRTSGVDTGWGVDDECVRKAPVAQKDGLGPLGTHVAVWIVEGTFHGQLVEDHLCKVHRVHAEVTAACAAPCSSTVGADVPHGQQQGRVLQQPSHQCVIDRHNFAEAGFETQLERPELPSDDPDACLNASIGLRIVSGRMLSADLGDALHLDPDFLQALLH